MRHFLSRAAVGALALFVGACSSHDVTQPIANPAGPRAFAALAGVPTVFISEFHYDNTGTDVNEKIEVTFPTGTSLTGYALVLYNGSGGATYTPVVQLTALTATSCGGGSPRSTVVADYPSNGIQNGTPDGIALIRVNSPSDTTLIEFLSYEGAFAGSNGKANGVLSNNIGVIEDGTGPINSSLQRDLTTGYFAGPATSTFGACNTVSVPAPAITHVDLTPAPASAVAGDSRTFTAAAYAGTAGGGTTIPGTVFTWSTSNPEIATVNQSGVVTTIDVGTVQIRATAPNNVVGSATLTVTAPAVLPPVRFTELHYDNTGTDIGEGLEIEAPAGTDLTGWSVNLYSLSAGVVTQYDTRILSGAVPTMCNGRGVVVLEYPSNGIQNGPNDGFALLDKNGALIEFLSYEGSLTASINGANVVSQDIGASQNSAVIGTSLQRSLAGTWASAPSNFYGCNGRTSGRSITGFSFSGRDPVADPPLPVGFQAQIFGTAQQGATILPFTWSAVTPSIATIDADGVITALAEGSAVFRATTTDGLSTATYTLPMAVGVQSVTAHYAGNTEFGDPVDGDASDDLIIRRLEYTTSFNVNRNTANWVSYDLDASHSATGVDRCNCFTYDPELPQAKKYTTAAYTGIGTVYNRGHLTRSADRTTGSLDNAHTYYFGNVVPQAADNNQGPWAVLENYLGDLARNSNKEVYIIAGVAGNIGTLKDEGKIVIPASLWKVAVIMPRDQGLANVTSLSSIEVVAVIMPNVNGIRDVPWETYKTTVDAVEALSGYDLLSLLRDDIEIAVESNTKPPVARTNGPYTEIMGTSIPMSAATSSEPDGDALTFRWSFGDGATATGVNVAHTYVASGVFTVRLIARDIRGLEDTVTTTATVQSASQALDQAMALANALDGVGKINHGNVTSLNAKLLAAQQQADLGGNGAAINILQATLNELDALVQTKRANESDVAALRAKILQAIAALQL